MKNDHIALIFLLLFTIECFEGGGQQFFDQINALDSVKVNLKKISKKQSETSEPPKEPAKQIQTGKSQKELLEEQLQQIQKYTPANITIEGGRVFTQSSQIQEQQDDQEDENDMEYEDELDSEADQDEVLMAIKQIDSNAQLEGIEFIFKKRLIDQKRMIGVLEMLQNGEIEITLKQIKKLSQKYQLEKLFYRAILSLNISDQPESEEGEEFDNKISSESDDFTEEDQDEYQRQNLVQDVPTQLSNDSDFDFNDLIEFDNDEVNSFENPQEEQFSPNNADDIDNFDLPDEPDDNFLPLEFDDILSDNLITNGNSELEEFFEEELKVEELRQNKPLMKEEDNDDDFEELLEEEFEYDEEEEPMGEETLFLFDLQNKKLKEDEKLDNFLPPSLHNSESFLQVSNISDYVLSKEEQNRTYLGDQALDLTDFNFQENQIEVKFEKEFDFPDKKMESNLTELQSQFNLSEENLDLINKKYESMYLQFTPDSQITNYTSLNLDEQPQLIQLSQQEETKITNTNDSSQIEEAVNNVKLDQDNEDLISSSLSNDKTQNLELVMQEQEKIPDSEKENLNNQEVQPDQVSDIQSTDKVNEEQQQLSRKNIKQITSKPAEPHELTMSNSAEAKEKSEEEIAKEKEIKAKARYAKRYQALDVESEKHKNKEEEETHYVKVKQDIDDIFIIQSLTSTKKNNVVEMKDLKMEEPKDEQLSESNQSNQNIEIYNSIAEQQIEKTGTHKTQHFVEAFVQDMSLKSYQCDPKYFGPNKEARQFVCECSDKIFLLDEESWYLAGTIQFYKQYEKIFEQIKKSIPLIYVGASKDKVCFSSSAHQPIIFNDFLKEMFLKTKIQNTFIQIPNIVSLSYVQLEFSENKIKNFIMEVESNDEIKLNVGFNIKKVDMKLATDDLHIQYIGSFLTNQQQIPFRLTNQYGKLKIDTMELTVQLPQDELICLQICEQILSGDVAKQLQAFLNFKKGQYQITVKVLSSNESFEIFYSIRS